MEYATDMCRALLFTQVLPADSVNSSKNSSQVNQLRGKTVSLASLWITTSQMLLEFSAWHQLGLKNPIVLTLIFNLWLREQLSSLICNHPLAFLSITHPSFIYSISNMWRKWLAKLILARVKRLENTEVQG